MALSPFDLRALLSSTIDTPCLFLGRFSFESRAKCGRLCRKAVNIDCLPLSATASTLSLKDFSESMSIVTISKKTRATCRMQSTSRFLHAEYRSISKCCADHFTYPHVRIRGFWANHSTLRLRDTKEMLGLSILYIIHIYVHCDERLEFAPYRI